VPLISQPLVDYLRGKAPSQDSSRPCGNGRGEGEPDAGEKKRKAAVPVG